MSEQKRYGVRIYKDGKPCLEYAYYSLQEIYEHSMSYVDKKELIDTMVYKLKDSFPEKFDHTSTYNVKIVYYPNKKINEEIAKSSEFGKFNSNGVESSYLPLLYKEDKEKIKDSYLRGRFHKLMQFNSRFRLRLLDFYDSSTELAFDKDGNEKEKSSMVLFKNILDIMQDLNANVTQDKLTFDIDRLYKKIFGSGFKERIKIYHIIESEFPIKKAKSIPELKDERSLKLKISFRDFFLLPKSERDNYEPKNTERGDLLWLQKWSTKEYNKEKER